jgi:hypothetical protein
MTTETCLRGAPNILAPDDLRMAADAFDAALRALDEISCPYEPHAARQIIARYIIERALNGERDPAKLGAGALMCLDIIGSAGYAARGAKRAPATSSTSH